MAGRFRNSASRAARAAGPGRRRADATLKLAVVGGGSSYTPELIEGVLREHGRLPISEVALLDVPAGREKAEIVAALAARMARAAVVPVTVRATLDPQDALSGADFVVSQFRAGGLRGRQRDEHLPLRHGLLGQETTGAGGFANALRTVPQALALAEAMRTLCPSAWLVNFTNPSGLVTEALLKHGFPRTVGLCNAAINVERKLATRHGVDPSEVSVTAMGLNHLTWMRLFVRGEDVTRAALAERIGDDGGGTGFGDERWPWPRQFLDALGMLPNGYLRYYYFTAQAVAEERAAVDRGEGTRADRVIRLEAELFRLYRDSALREKPALLGQRGGAYYSEAAVRLMVGLSTGEGAPQVLNVQNHGALPGLPDDAVVEVSCTVDKGGAHPVSPGPMPPMVRGLVQAVKAYEELTIEAARTARRDLAYAALVAHPLVRSPALAEPLLAEILEANRADLPPAWHVR